MNQELKVAYQSLSTGEREHLLSQYANSPKALMLIDFLEAHKGNDFTNQQIIPHLYPNEESSFETLRNRYFKLRKQLLDAISALGQESKESTYALPEEQAELYHIKQNLMQQGHYGVARQKLETLVKRLWQENVFELLPDAIQRLIHCGQVMGELKQLEGLYDDWELAIALQRDIVTIKMLSAKAFNTFHSHPVDGFEKVLTVMAQMKRIVLGRKAYPRFELAYHLSHLLNGAATAGNRLGALTRHLKSYERLRKEYPKMPSLFYENNYLWIEHFRFLYAKGLYHYMKQDIKTFYQTQAEAFQLTKKIPELRGTRSENMYLNKIRTEVMLGLYHEAQETAKAMMVFQKENKLTLNLWKSHLELGRLYVYSYPAVKPDDLPKFIHTLEKNLKLAQSSMGEVERGESNGVVAILKFFNRDYRAALQTYERPETVWYFQQTGVDVFHKIFQLPFNAPPNPRQLQEEVKIWSYRTEVIAYKDLLQRGIYMIEHYAKGSYAP